MAKGGYKGPAVDPGEKRQGSLTWKNTRISEDKGHQKDVYEDIGY